MHIGTTHLLQIPRKVAPPQLVRQVEVEVQKVLILVLQGEKMPLLTTIFARIGSIENCQPTFF